MSIPTLQKEIEAMRKHLWFYHLFPMEGSASLEELQYLANLVQEHHIKFIGEIGFNEGLSSLAFLEADTDTKVVSFDIGEHPYAKAAKRYIDKKFPGRHEIVWGNSKKAVPQFKKNYPDRYFEFIFIDGSHDYQTAKVDIVNMEMLAQKETLVVMDDITPWLKWGKGPTQAWTEALQEGLIIQEELYKDGKRVDRIKPPGERSWALGRYVF